MLHQLAFLYLAIYAILFSCFYLTIRIILHDKWKQGSSEGDVIETFDQFQGLWSKCQDFGSGMTECEDFDKFFVALPMPIIMARILVCMSCCFQGIPLILMPLAWQCFRIPESVKVKTCLYTFCGVCLFLAFLFIGVAVSWYAALVLNLYWHDQSVYGPALWYGWGVMCGLFLISIASCFMPKLTAKAMKHAESEIYKFESGNTQFTDFQNSQSFRGQNLRNQENLKNAENLKIAENLQIQESYMNARATVCKNQTKLNRMFDPVSRDPREPARNYRPEEFNNSIQVQEVKALVNDQYYDYI